MGLMGRSCLVPILVIDTISRSNQKAELEQKINKYFF
jgi:hypothetical protein